MSHPQKPKALHLNLEILSGEKDIYVAKSGDYQGVPIMNRRMGSTAVHSIDPPISPEVDGPQGVDAVRFRPTQPALKSLIHAGNGAMQQVLALALMVAKRETTILIQGETGTGKGLLARVIHESSTRARNSFVGINCGGLEANLLTSELFGHERGSFTGATARKIGLFEAAAKGTLFLDEIGEMALSIQVKLLRALEERLFRRVGGVTELAVSTRIIGATNRDLRACVDQGRFREDLYFRLNIFPLHIPPLRERGEDILPLAEHFLRRFRPQVPPLLTSSARRWLQTYQWPGNVRELRNVIERATILCPQSPLHDVHLEMNPNSRNREAGVASNQPTCAITQPSANDEPPLTLEELTKRHLGRVLFQQNGDVEACAGILGISRATLYRKIKKYGLAHNWALPEPSTNLDLTI